MEWKISKYLYWSSEKPVLLWLNVMTLIFFDWSLHNSHTYFWSCDDVGKFPMLKVATERAIEKLPHYDLAGNLFNVDHGIYKHQFVGFISSYTWFNVLTLFHLHSFVTFCTDSDSNTVVTCSLTTRHHILSNMQDRLIQLLQLMQFWKNESFSLKLTNTIIGSDVKVNQDSIHGQNTPVVYSQMISQK